MKTPFRSMLTSAGAGLALCLGLAAAAIGLGRWPWLAAHGLGALTIAILLGLVVGHAAGRPLLAAAGPGVAFSRQWLLRAGVVLYGLRLTVQDIARVGAAGVLIDALVLASTFGLAWWVGTRLLRLDRTTAMLVGAGSAICGAAAVMATEPVVKARAEQVTVAVSTVVLFGTLATLLYPALYRSGLLPADARAFGLYAGSTIHEVAQVVAAAQSAGGAVADTAVIAKMVRVMMLAPFLMALSAWLARGQGGAVAAGRGRIALPWFALLFVGVVLLNSLSLLPMPAVAAANEVDTLLLAMAMSALGLTTQGAAIRRAGARPLLLGAALFAWLVAGGAAINGVVARLCA